MMSEYICMYGHLQSGPVKSKGTTFL